MFFPTENTAAFSPFNKSSLRNWIIGVFRISCPSKVTQPIIQGICVNVVHGRLTIDIWDKCSQDGSGHKKFPQ